MGEQGLWGLSQAGVLAGLGPPAGAPVLQGRQRCWFWWPCCGAVPDPSCGRARRGWRSCGAQAACSSCGQRFASSASTTSTWCPFCSTKVDPSSSTSPWPPQICPWQCHSVTPWLWLSP